MTVMDGIGERLSLRIDAAPLLASAIESIGQGIALFDRADRLILCNGRYRDILNRCTIRLVPGTRSSEIYRHAAQHGQFENAGPGVEALMNHGPAFNRRPTEPIEQKFCEGRWIRIEERRTADGGMISVLTDITDCKLIEDRTRAFMSVVAHELRTPFTAIKGSLALLESGAAGQLPQNAASMVSVAHTSTARLTRLVDDLLDQERIEAGSMAFAIQPVELGPLLERVRDSLQGYLGRCRVSLRLDLPASPDTVMADPDRLTQVLDNLISNAAKFSPEGATVTLRTERCGSRVRISVSDHGPGIAEEFRGIIFDRFAQSDSSANGRVSGSGLGLCIAKGIVERHGGRLDFTTRIGHGTCFFFDLPTQSGRQGAWPVPAPGPRPKILVLDDDRTVRRRIKRLLARLGYEATTCATAATARKRIGAGNFGAVTVDLTLPEHGAAEFIGDLRRAAKTEDLPIIAVAAKAGVGRTELCGRAADIVDWIDNPLDIERLRSAAERVARDLAARRLSVLHVGSDADQRTTVARGLRDLAAVARARSVAEASRLLQGTSYDLVILDPAMLDDGAGRPLLPARADGGVLRLLLSPARPVPQSHLARILETLVAERAAETALQGQIHDLLNARRAEAKIEMFA